MIAPPPPQPPALVEEIESSLARLLADEALWQPPPCRHSVYEEGDREAMRHKWIESERAGRDLGEEALRHWARRHWAGFIRGCWLEHLYGNRYWAEVDRGDFGLLRRGPHDHPTLFAKVVRLLEAGQENLDIILWAQEVGAPMGTVLRILEILDINSRRLPHRFDL